MATRNENDRRGIGRGSELFSDLEAVDVGKLDVEQDEFGPKARRRHQRRLPVGGLSQHLETAGFQQRSSERAKLGVIVDDQDRLPHRQIVARTRSPRIGATPPPSQLTPSTAIASRTGSGSTTVRADPALIRPSVSPNKTHLEVRRASLSSDRWPF
jgi:hypothetical protein